MTREPLFPRWTPPPDPPASVHRPRVWVAIFELPDDETEPEPLLHPIWGKLTAAQMERAGKGLHPTGAKIGRGKCATCLAFRPGAGMACRCAKHRQPIARNWRACQEKM